MSVETKQMTCVNNEGYEDCLTVGKEYLVTIEYFPSGDSMKKMTDDNGEFLQTMIDRFE